MAERKHQRRLTLFIGPSEKLCARVRALCNEHAGALEKQGIVAINWNHVRLYAACANPDEVGILRYRRGMSNPLVPQTLFGEMRALLEKEMPQIKADHIILSASQLGSLLSTQEERKRLKSLLAPHFDDIRIVAHVDEQARALSAHYTYAVMEGRRHALQSELDLIGCKDWWATAKAAWRENIPHFGEFNDIQRPPFWLDYAGLFKRWGETFGPDQVTLRPLHVKELCGRDGAAELERVLDLPKSLGTSQTARIFQPETAPSLTRMRQFNDVLIRYMRLRDIICPRDLWSQLLQNLRVPGDAIAPGSLFTLSDHFRADNAALIERFPDLGSALAPDDPLEPWQEADPTNGYRATQYLSAFSHGINKNSTPVAQKHAEAAAATQASEKFETLLTDDAASKETAEANARLLNRVKINHQMVLGSRFKPHNDLGSVNEEDSAPDYAPMTPRELPANSSGNVIVGCMKNEAPYIIEWIAYHRAIGVDNFLIYTNDCSDGTDDILGRLQDMGILQHRNNDKWKGNSPQQHALNQALKEPIIQNAQWIAHIDVDEFMNVRTGNGTLDDLFDAVPDATNFAMTWRLFGHNGVTRLSDDFVIDQFDSCAPKYCPKPHTVWGFKTMFRNMGAYAKISCHRPNKLNEAFENRVKWVNGSGSDMTSDAIKNGWRSSKNNVGYDLLQLNHYALRSAESFLIKRQRGRALHVDRSIGINYWIRMDWGDFRDITIKRNIPRLRAEYDRLMRDPELRQAHEDGLSWHRAKAEELHDMPEFSGLYKQALSIKLDETERVAYALALDMES